MRGSSGTRRNRALLAAVLLLGVAGCTPAARAPATAPPVPADLDPRPHMWARVELAAQVPDAQLNAVAGGEGGFVAAGAASTGPGFNGIVWWSADGVAWTDVGGAMRLDGVDIADVAWGPAGWIVVGQRRVADLRSEMVTLVSADGTTWREPNLAAARLQDTAPVWIESDGDGYLVGATTEGGASSVVLRSRDGTRWVAEQPQPSLRLVRGRGLWIGLGRGAAGTSEDAREWTVAALEGSPDGRIADAAFDGAEGRDGVLVLALLTSGSCGGGASCAATTWGWRSEDGADWRILPEAAWPFDGGPLAVGASEEGRIVAIGNHRLYTSWDGWHWAPLIPGDVPAPVPGQASDIAVLGDRIVVVGLGGEGAGSPWIATAGARE